MEQSLQPFVLKTRRLTLGNFRPGDWRCAQRLFGVPEVARMLATVSAPWPDSEVQRWIEERRFKGKIGFGLAVFDANAHLIGAVAIGGKPAGIGYLFGKAFWGQGYATEAVGAFVKGCFARFADLDQVSAEVMDDNPASARVLTKLGFEPAGAGQCTSLARLEPVPNTLYRVDRNTLKVDT